MHRNVKLQMLAVLAVGAARVRGGIGKTGSISGLGLCSAPKDDQRER